MKKEDEAEGRFAHHEKDGTRDTCCKLLKNRQKNGILPWKNAEKKMLALQTNEAEQRSLEARNERIPLISCQEISRPPLLLFEDNAEDFDTELTSFNDLWDTNDQVSCNEYLPYYRTYASLLEVPHSINTGMKEEDTEREGGVQSNECVFKSIYEDEPLNGMGLVTGIVPYYRSYEEYLGSPDLPSEVHSRADSEEAETDSPEEIESEIDCEVEEVLENAVVPGECNTDEYDNQCLEELTDNHLLPDSIINPCHSEISLLDESLSPEYPSPSGYFPFYRTYGQLFLSPVASSNTEFSIEVKRFW
ncbi:UNVERIFIED_CONTAM: hypothetical protein K2H54_033589 [Gekko kuhli]